MNSKLKIPFFGFFLFFSFYLFSKISFRKINSQNFLRIKTGLIAKKKLLDFLKDLHFAFFPLIFLFLNEKNLDKEFIEQKIKEIEEFQCILYEIDYDSYLNAINIDYKNDDEISNLFVFSYKTILFSIENNKLLRNNEDKRIEMLNYDDYYDYYHEYYVFIAIKLLEFLKIKNDNLYNKIYHNFLKENFSFKARESFFINYFDIKKCSLILLSDFESRKIELTLRNQKFCNQMKILSRNFDRTIKEILRNSIISDEEILKNIN